VPYSETTNIVGCSQFVGCGTNFRPLGNAIKAGTMIVKLHHNTSSQFGTR